MQFIDLAKARHSTRSFTDQPVPPAQLQAILEATNLAPSAGNMQAYELYVVATPAQRMNLARAAGGKEFLEQAPVVLAFCANPARNAERYGCRGEQLYAVQDATIACTFAMLAATSFGLGSVWVGSFDEELVRQALGAPEGVRPVALLPIGYAAELPEPRPRRPLDDLARWL